MSESIFRKESIKKVTSPEELHDYIRVSSPSVWLLIGAVAALLIGVLIWAAFGTLDSTVTVSGVSDGGVVRCYVSESAGIQAGSKVWLNGTEGTVRSVSRTPLSRAAAAQDCGGDEYTVYRLNLADWNYVVELDVAGVPDGFVSAKILTERIHPLSFIFG